MDSFAWLALIGALLILASCVVTARAALHGRREHIPATRWTCEKGHTAPPCLVGRVMTCAVCGSSRITRHRAVLTS